MKYVDNKVVLIGTGAVGMAYAFAVANQGLADELVLIDLNERKSRADVLDLNHGEAWAPQPVSVSFGDYGDSELPVWSAATVAGRSISRRIAAHPDLAEELDEIFARTRDAAYDIIDAKGSTSYGVGMALARITRAIMRNEKVTLPVSALLEGDYGHRDLYIGVPASVGRRGIRQIVELDLDEQEQAAFDRSVASLETAMAPARADGTLPA